MIPELENIISNFEFFNSNTTLKYIEQLERSDLFAKLTFNEKLLLYFYKIRTNNWLQRCETSVLSFDEMQIFYATNFFMHDELSELIFGSVRIWRLLSKHKYDETRNLIDKVNSIIPSLIQNNLSNSNSLLYKLLIHFYLDTSQYYCDIKELDIMFDYLELALKQAKIFGNHFYLYASYNALIMAHLYLRDYSKVDEYLIETESIDCNEILCPTKLWIVQNLSAENMWLGRLKYALKYNEIVLNTVRSIKSNEENWYFLNYYSNICRFIITMFMGKYRECLKWAEKSEVFANSISEKFDDHIPLSSVYGNLGESYYYLDNHDESFEYIMKGLNLRIVQPYAITHLSDSFYSLIRLLVKINELDKAEQYLKQFESYIKKWDKERVTFFELVHAYYSIAKATILMAKKTMKTNSEAQILFKKIVDENRVKKELIIGSLLPLIELSIQEYKLFQSDETLNELKDLINKLNDLVNKTSSIILKIQSLIIQGKLNIILGNFDQFEMFFNKAKNIAQDYELSNVEKWIISELDNFQTELKKWQSLISTNSSIKQRIELIELEDYVKGIQHILYEE